MSRTSNGPVPDPFLDHTREVLADPSFAGQSPPGRLPGAG